MLGEQTYDCAVEVYSAGEESHARVNPTGKNLNGKKKKNNRGRLLAGAACWRWNLSGQVNFRTQREKVIKSKFVLEEDGKKPMSMDLDLESGFPCFQNCQKITKSVRIIKIRDQDADK